MSYYPHAPKEPGGCAETAIVTRAILGILLIPVAIIVGAIATIIFAFYALTIHPLFGLAVVVGGVLIVIAAAKWESKRAAKDFPPDEP